MIEYYVDCTIGKLQLLNTLAIILVVEILHWQEMFVDSHFLPLNSLLLLVGQKGIWLALGLNLLVIREIISFFELILLLAQTKYLVYVVNSITFEPQIQVL
jgi:hypothetical protein